MGSCGSTKKEKNIYQENDVNVNVDLETNNNKNMPKLSENNQRPTESFYIEKNFPKGANFIHNRQSNEGDYKAFLQGGLQTVELFASFKNFSKEEIHSSLSIKISISLDQSMIFESKVESLESLVTNKKATNKVKHNDDGTLDFYFDSSSIIEYTFEKQQQMNIDLAFSDGDRYNETTTLAKLMGSRKNSLSLNTSHGELLIECKIASGRDIEYSTNLTLKISNSLYLGKELCLVLSNYNNFWRKIYKTEEKKLVDSNKISSNAHQISNNNDVNLGREYHNIMNNNGSQRLNSNNRDQKKEEFFYYITFNSIEITADLLNNNEPASNILLEVFEFNNNCHQKLLEGQVVFSNELENQNNSFYLTPSTKACTKMPNNLNNNNEDLSVVSDSNKKDYNYEVVLNFSKKRKIKFLDLLYKGLQISLSVGIDFTGSNGDPHDEISLHYCLDKSNPNAYEKAMTACANVISYYDYDQRFPLLGFGGIPKGNNTAQHCFPLNNNMNDPNVLGVDGLIQTYKNTLETITLANPTLFHPLISGLSNFIKSNISNNILNMYYIILILTDGIVDDLYETMEFIRENQDLPVSFIMVGIGDNDFSVMSSMLSEISNIHFVDFKNYENKNQLSLAEELLKKIPKQVEDYYESNPNMIYGNRKGGSFHQNKSNNVYNNNSNSNNKFNSNMQSNSNNNKNNLNLVNNNNSNNYFNNNMNNQIPFELAQINSNINNNNFNSNYNNNIPGSYNNVIPSNFNQTNEFYLSNNNGNHNANFLNNDIYQNTNNINFEKTSNVNRFMYTQNLNNENNLNSNNNRFQNTIDSNNQNFNLQYNQNINNNMDNFGTNYMTNDFHLLKNNNNIGNMGSYNNYPNPNFINEDNFAENEKRNYD